MPEMRIEELDASTDIRGLSFSILEAQLDKIGPVRDVHIGEIRAGHIRGNHYHIQRGELIAVIFTDRWSLHWDTGAGTDVHVKQFEGIGAVAVIPPNNWSHAIRNDGANSMWIIAASDKSYDRHDPSPHRRDAITRIVAD